MDISFCLNEKKKNQWYQAVDQLVSDMSVSGRVPGLSPPHSKLKKRRKTKSMEGKNLSCPSVSF